MVACAKNSEQQVISGKATIKQSIRLTQDTMVWRTDGQSPNLTIDTDQSIELDFGGAVVQSHLLGESPKQYQGTAIHIKKAPKVTIKNARFLGFRKGIQVEQVDSLQIINCAFVDFARTTNEAPSSAAITIQQTNHLRVEQSLFKHLATAFEIEAATDFIVSDSKFHWLTQQVVQASDAATLSFERNQLFYIGIPNQENIVFISGNVKTFRQNLMAHIMNPSSILEQFFPFNNPTAYIHQIEVSEQIRKEIDQALREMGVATPSLRLIDEWSWYDFSYPRAWPRARTPEKDIYLVTAPNGNWRLIGGKGYSKVVPKTGSFPTTIQAFPNQEEHEQELQFEYLGKSINRYGSQPAQISPISFSINNQ